MTDLIHKAETIIEDMELTSYVLDPVKHYRDLITKVPEITPGLRMESISVAAEEYVRSDKEAVNYQRDYLKWQKNVFKFSFGATCASAIMISYPAISAMLKLNDKIDNIILIVLTILIALYSAAAIMAQHQVTQRNLLKHWMNVRAKAESFRIQYFTLLTKVERTDNPAKDVFQCLLKLSYFVKFQLRVQLEFLEKRGKDHKKQYDRLKHRTAIGLGAVALGGMISGMSGLSETAYASFAFIGLIAGAFVAMKNEENSIFQYQRTHQRYESTREILINLRNMLDQLKPKILSGNLSVLEDYVKTVNDCISTEHRQWLDLKDETNTLIGELQKKLKTK